MDYFGRQLARAFARWDPLVSILLGQWITLEVTSAKIDIAALVGFNPSGSMDYFGSWRFVLSCLCPVVFQSFWVNGLLWKNLESEEKDFDLLFQSFWVNGLLWKQKSDWVAKFWFKVSILLGQWITLEDNNPVIITLSDFSFNPSGSMDYFGRLRARRVRPHTALVSILLGQWITLEV